MAELRALAHPVRLRILELFAEEPRTTKKVAELLGLPPTRLYHHVAALERAGLLVLRQTRQNRGAVEKWYEAVVRQMRTGPRDDGSAKGRAARRAVAMTVMEQARQDVMAAIARPGKEPALLMHFAISARHAEIPGIRRQLVELVERFQRDVSSDAETDEPAEDLQRWAVTLSLAPTSATTFASNPRKRSPGRGHRE
ncbi:MAG TPA: winged helix-turn-helix domain-containing protein [Gemmatimonadaceae bacterium]